MRIKIVLVLMAVVMLTFNTACDLFDNLINIKFETDWVELEFTVNPTEPGERTLTEKVKKSDIKKEVEDHGGKIESLDEIRPYEATLAILTEKVTFDTFDWVEVYVSAPGIDEKLVASATIAGTGWLDVDLEVSGVDLVDILEEEEYTVRVVAYLNDKIVDPVDMILKVKYQVVV